MEAKCITQTTKTIQLTMTDEEAAVLRWLMGWDHAIPEMSMMRPAKARIKHLMGAIRDALTSAGVHYHDLNPG